MRLAAFVAVILVGSAFATSVTAPEKGSSLGEGIEKALKPLSRDGGAPDAGNGNGLTREQLSEVIHSYRRRAYPCFEPLPDCAVRVRFRVARSGEVVEVISWRGEEPLPKAVTQCLDRELRTWRFPKAPRESWVAHTWECKKSQE